MFLIHRLRTINNMGCLMIDNHDFCEQIVKLLQDHCNCLIVDIGSLDVTFTSEMLSKHGAQNNMLSRSSYGIVWSYLQIINVKESEVCGHDGSPVYRASHALRFLNKDQPPISIAALAPLP